MSKSSEGSGFWPAGWERCSWLDDCEDATDGDEDEDGDDEDDDGDEDDDNDTASLAVTLALEEENSVGPSVLSGDTVSLAVTLAREEKAVGPSALSVRSSRVVRGSSSVYCTAWVPIPPPPPVSLL